MIHTRPRDVSILTARDFSQCRFTPTTFGWGDTTAVNKWREKQKRKVIFKLRAVLQFNIKEIKSTYYSILTLVFGHHPGLQRCAFHLSGLEKTNINVSDHVSESKQSLSLSQSMFSLPPSLGGGGSLSASLSELWPLDLRWCEEGEGGVGEAFGVGGKVVMLVMLGEFGLAGVLSKPWVAFPFCRGGDLFFVTLAPFLAFLNSTDVRRPTPINGRVGGVPRGVTS